VAKPLRELPDDVELDDEFELEFYNGGEKSEGTYFIKKDGLAG